MSVPRRLDSVATARFVAVFALAFALAGCGGGSGSPAAGASSAAAAQRRPMALLVPLYGYPTETVRVTSASGVITSVTQLASAWAAVAAGAASVPTVAIVNPNNGPVTCTDPPSATLAAFQQGIAALHAAGVTVLGYVHTSYARRAQSAVEQDVRTYAACYGIDGIFFDEVATGASSAGYDAALAAEARANIHPASGAAAVVAINPGAYPDPAVAQTADITVMHESADLALPPVPAGLSAYPAGRFGYLAFAVDQPLQPTLSALWAGGTGYVYVTDRGSGGTDPWSRIATDYAGLVQKVQSLNAAPGR